MSYSEDGNVYLPFFKFPSNGSGEWTPVRDNTICHTVFSNSDKVYLRFNFKGGGQVDIPTVILSKEKIEGVLFNLFFPLETEFDEPIVVQSSFESIFGIDRVFPVGVMRLERI